jgi:CMP-N-acetylneuraminic acid synthetase
MVRTSVLKEVGGYRDDLGAQDGLDLWLKLKNKFKAINVNLPLFYYRRHGKNLTEQPIKIINARRALKKDRYRMAVNQIKPIIAVIPCREKYDFVENLWDQKINNKSLLELSIDRCVESNEFDYIVICADNRNVESTVLKYRDDKRVRFLYRDPSLTVLSKGIGETLKVVQQCYDANCSGILVIVYLQTPFVSKDTIEEAISSLVISESHSAFAVEEIRHDVFLKGENGLTVIKNNLKIEKIQ